MANEPQPIFNPSDDIVIAYRDAASQVALSLSIGEIKALVNSWGYNTFILSPTYWNYYEEMCYTNIIVFNTYGENIPTEYYIGDNSYIQAQGVNSGALCFQNPLYPNTALSWVTYNYRNGSWYRSNSETSPTWATSKQWNNIWYWVKSIETGVTIPQYWCCTANIETLYINGSPVIEYQWSSVPAISGKNGILSLTQILNINDGEPVENITNKGNLDFSKKTKVNTLVNSAYEPTYKEDQTKATIEYEIPEAEYQYTKLVYKKKKIPKSPNDGTAIDIGADDTEAFVSGLEENTTYYFVVFTNRTKSNAYKFKTGKKPELKGIFFMRTSVSKVPKDSNFIETVTVSRV